ncbi:MAG: hypothetical protein ACYS0I_04640 [Planctomycetota bacterium]
MNNIDPSGQFSLGEMLQVSTIIGTIAAGIAGTVTAIRGGSVREVLWQSAKWFWISFAVTSVIYCGIWAIHSLWIAIFGGGASTISAEQAVKYGYETRGELVNAWRDLGFNIDRTQHVHHFVQQLPSNIQKFGPKAIHSLANSIPMRNAAHINQIHSYTNSSTTTLNLTQYVGQHYSHLHEYISTLSYGAQQAWGTTMYNYVQIHDSMAGFDPVSLGLL